MCRRLFLILTLALCPLLPAQEPERKPFFKDGERVVFLGDSITMDGRYIAVLDLLVRTRMPDSGVTLLNLGLSSETASGLSEAHHPWPRPSVHERAGRVLEKTHPTTVVICYGMNDGIYAPFAEDRFAAYQQAMRDLVAKCRAAGARVVVLTPPPFDAASVKSRMLPVGGGDYGFMTPYEHYDEVIQRYGEWLLSTAGLADKVIDLHGPLSATLKAWRSTHPDWSSGDGVHPVAAIHWLIAMLVAEGLDLPAAVAKEPAPDSLPGGGWRWTFRTPPPLPEPDAESAAFLQAAGFPAAMNALRLTLPDAGAAAWRLKENGRLLAVVTADQLARGLDLTALSNLSLNRDAAAALPLAMARHKLLSGAWREHCGHQRPQTDRNFPPLAEAEEKVASIQADMQGLLTARDVELTLERAGQPDAPAGSEHRGAGLTVRLVSEVAAVQAGQPFSVGLLVRHDPGYHTYWKCPGLAGVPTSLEWELPAGWTAGPIEWPSPASVKMADINTFGYEHDVLLTVSLTPPAALEGGAISLPVTASWMCCARSCHPGFAHLRLNLPVKPAAEPDAAWVPAFAASKITVPQPLRGWTFTAVRGEKAITLTGKSYAGLTLPPAPEFFSDDATVCSHTPQKWEAKDGGFVCVLPLSTYGPKTPASTLTGLLSSSGKWHPGQETSAASISVPIAAQ